VVGVRKFVLLFSIVLGVLLTSAVALAQTGDTTPPETMLSSWEHPDPYESYTSATFGFSAST
jgi:hypothetical protein